MSLTIAQAAADLASKLGYETLAGATAQAQQDIATAINGAMQMLQTAGQDFFTRQTHTITLSAGTSIYSVPASVQSVLGPVRWNDTKPLKALTSQGEYDEFSRIFMDGTSHGVGSNGDPIAYWVKYLRSGSQGEICAVTIQLAPAPAAPAGTLVAEVVNDAPAYTVANLTDTTVLPVAQNYTESVFLPIARMLVTRSSQFSRPSLLAQLTEDFQRAMGLLSTVGGFPNAQQQKLPREVTA